MRKQGGKSLLHISCSRASKGIQSLQLPYLSAPGTVWKKNFSQDLNATISKLNYKFIIAFPKFIDISASSKAVQFPV